MTLDDGKPPARSSRSSPSAMKSRSRTRRRAAIARYHILDSSAEADFDNIAMLAGRICATQSAAISFIDDDRQWFKSRCGIEASETPIEASFCAYAIGSADILVVNDATRDIRFAANPLVVGDPWVRFYAGMPILASDGTPMASLCVFDPVPRPRGLTEIEAMTLRVLASQVQSLLELRRSHIEREAQAAAKAILSKEWKHAAEHDVLTGLPHRGVFQKRLRAAMREAERNNTRVAMMLVDVDHFKQINDTLGHDAGDALLRGFANRLQSVLRKSDTVARLGGDEFGILLSGIRREEQVASVVRSMTERLHEPLLYKDRLVACNASIGVAIYPDHALTADRLTKCSDLALAEAKRTRGRAETFSAGLAADFERNARMLTIARKAIDERRFVAHYQPKIDLTTGGLVGFEALVRCDRVGKTPILPRMFAQAFADRPIALEISRQMMACVLDDIRCWQDRGLRFGHVAINTCAADFMGDDFAERLLSAIEARRLHPGVIELEVTEGVFLGRGAHHVARALTLLSTRGMRIALDDFGTGYASLTHLKQFPVDVLKIDRSFVAGIGKNAGDAAIVRALIGLGSSLGIETVAEGIETSAQAEFVKSHGCDVGQGFLYSAAQGPASVPALITRFAVREAA
ncbi:putative bifunctional diguanylate cyclase/phosphodiesterase [Sphingomonas japonica]|uniref:Diguanylate cyclase (GGDEF)-like protein n=1 Tax=Sphingomonas japonica TaxID=511662 RepID=A0ABX0U7K7_9SPHN|nr:EAL domain-containing protein [Sphingomonas japonica]NIJ25212.1 diguanylate cyclase (GGDEF)-like protein [Sphingomonas japonica]